MKKRHFTLGIRCPQAAGHWIRKGIALAAWLASTGLQAQQAYFADGYHGGIYGHYPLEWKTRFIVDQLEAHPEWRIGLEIEPETWDSVQARTPEAYARFCAVAAGKQVEFTNPAYAQPYAYNISGESLIRHFQYGLKKLRQHFPEAEWVTYAAEEPCFTSCMPQLLKSFGVKYAVLKCPDTCWGGYTQAHGGELVNWIGPDGTSLPAVPRYACEGFEHNSTWQTTAWANSEAYLQACADAGIRHPVGMCYQDAGWKNGPWIGSGDRIKNGSQYVRWRDYFEHVAPLRTDDDWQLSQEDIRVSLMWGSQVLQRIARQVRQAENEIVAAEKLALVGRLENGYSYDQKEMDEAWRTLMLAQHHDSWIVPYNGLRPYGTWADAIGQWTGNTIQTARRTKEEVFRRAGQSAEKSWRIRVYNTLGVARTEAVTLPLPKEYAGQAVEVRDGKGRTVESWNDGSGMLCFRPSVPSFGFATYSIAQKESAPDALQQPAATAGEFVLENDMYRLVFDLNEGGTLKSLVAKKLGDKEFADDNSRYRLAELRGYFYEQERFRSSREAPAQLTVLRNNPLEQSVKIKGTIASHPFVQVVTLRKGETAIDFDLTIDWQHNEGIGEYEEKQWMSNRRAFYDDRFKLRALFPAALEDVRISKDAPFDVCESRLESTFFNRWDKIKHNVVLRWVDAAEASGRYGLALLTDHTTAYSHGEGEPLGLTVQYAGTGLWGMNYTLTRPTRLRYALIPHRGTWAEAGLPAVVDRWNEPLTAACIRAEESESESFIELRGNGCSLSAAYMENGQAVLRLFNAAGEEKTCDIRLNMPIRRAEVVELDGRHICTLPLRKAGKDASAVRVSLPGFGIRTLRLHLATE